MPFKGITATDALVQGCIWHETSQIPLSSSAAGVESSLKSLSAVNDVAVEIVENTDGVDWLVTFLANTADIPLIRGTSSDATVAVNRMVDGHMPFAGSFAISFNGHTSEPLPYDVSAKEIELALETLATVNVVSVSQKASGREGLFSWMVTFSGSNVGDLNALSVNASTLYGNDVITAVCEDGDVTGLCDGQTAEGSQPLGGYFDISLSGTHSRVISFDDSADVVEAEIQSLLTAEGLNQSVTVTRVPEESRFFSYVWYITFSGFQSMPPPLSIVDSSNFHGSDAAVLVCSSVVVGGTCDGISTTSNVHAVDTITLAFQGFDFELPGLVTAVEGDTQIYTTDDLTVLLSSGDFIQIAGEVYQVSIDGSSVCTDTVVVTEPYRGATAYGLQMRSHLKTLPIAVDATTDDVLTQLNALFNDVAQVVVVDEVDREGALTGHFSSAWHVTFSGDAFYGDLPLLVANGLNAGGFAVKTNVVEVTQGTLASRSSVIGGSFSVGLNGSWTEPLDTSISAVDLQSAILEVLPLDIVEVSFEQPSDLKGSMWLVTFGPLVNVPQLEVDFGSLTGGAFAAVSTQVDGSEELHGSFSLVHGEDIGYVVLQGNSFFATSEGDYASKLARGDSVEIGGFSFTISFESTFDAVTIPLDQLSTLSGRHMLTKEVTVENIPVDASSELLKTMLEQGTDLQNITVEVSESSSYTQKWLITFPNQNPITGNIPELKVVPDGACAVDISSAVREVVTGNFLKGTFSITYDGETITDIPVDVSAIELQRQLQSMATIGSVEVSRSGPDIVGGYEWLVAFTSNHGDLQMMIADITAERETQEVRLFNRQSGLEVQTVSVGASKVDIAGHFKLSACNFSMQLAGGVSLMDGSDIVELEDAGVADMFSPGDPIALRGQTFSIARKNSSSLVLEKVYVGPSGDTEDVHMCEWVSTGPIPYDSSADDVKASLESMDIFGALTVNQSSQYWHGGFDWAILFEEGYRSNPIKDIPLLRFDTSQLSGTGVTFAVEETVAGIRGVGGYFRLSFRGETTGPIPTTASAADLQAAIESMASIGHVSVIQRESRNDLISWLVTFESSVDGDHLVGMSSGDLPLFTLDSSELVGVFATGEVSELQQGSLAVEGVGRRFDIGEYAKGATRSEIQSIALEVPPFTPEIQIIVSSNPETTDIDNLGGTFAIEVCEFTEAVPGLVNVQFNSSEVLVSPEFAAAIKVGDQLKIGNQAFTVAVDTAYNSQSFDIYSSYGSYGYGSGANFLCLEDCRDFNLIGTGEVDDCAVTSSWTEDCTQDCSDEDLNSLDSFIDEFCGSAGPKDKGSYASSWAYGGSDPIAPDSSRYGSYSSYAECVFSKVTLDGPYFDVSRNNIQAYKCLVHRSESLSHDASAGVVEAALELLPSVGDVSVTRSKEIWHGGYVWSITFSSPTVLGDQANMRVQNNLDGVTAKIDVKEVQKGSASLAGSFTLSYCELDSALDGSIELLDNSPVVQVHHSSVPTNLVPHMALKIGSNMFQVESVSQNEITLDKVYTGKSGVRADWFGCRWEESVDISFDASSDEMEAALNAIPTIGRVYVAKTSTSLKSQWDVTFASNGGNLQLLRSNTTLLEGSGRKFAMEEVISGSIPLQGKFVLEHKGTVSEPMWFDISAEDMEVALEAMDTIDEVMVSREGPTSDNIISWFITFTGSYNVGDTPLLVANSSMLVPASSSVHVQEVQTGTSALAGSFRLGFTSGFGSYGNQDEGGYGSGLHWDQDSYGSYGFGSVLMTGNIPHDASAADLKRSIEQLHFVENVTVTSTSSGLHGVRDWTVTFNKLRDNFPYVSGDIPLLFVDTTRLLGSNSEMSSTTIVDGPMVPYGEISLCINDECSAPFHWNAAADVVKEEIESIASFGKVEVKKTPPLDDVAMVALPGTVKLTQSSTVIRTTEDLREHLEHTNVVFVMGHQYILDQSQPFHFYMLRLSAPWDGQSSDDVKMYKSNVPFGSSNEYDLTLPGTFSIEEGSTLVCSSADLSNEDVQGGA